MTSLTTKFWQEKCYVSFNFEILNSLGSAQLQRRYFLVLTVISKYAFGSQVLGPPFSFTDYPN